VIFADVQLQPGDSAARLRELGIRLRHPRQSAAGGPVKILQPCPAFAGRCRVYADRPGYCRQFDCALLKSVLAGKTTEAGAVKVVSTAQRRAEKVRKLLRQLGETEETLALSKRFRRVRRRLECGDAIDEESADLYGQLTLAVHDLNYLLSEAFYPGA
jgi:Fe-S-cluster containining protein